MTKPKRKIGGGRKRLFNLYLNPYQKILLTLMRLRHIRTQVVARVVFRYFQYPENGTGVLRTQKATQFPRPKDAHDTCRE